MQLDFGAGDIKTEGYLRVDISPKCHPDYVWDITQFPYPKEWEGCEGVRADNVFEHIEPKKLIEVINEINRIMKPGGRLWFRVPLVDNTPNGIYRAFTDPTHVNFFTLGTSDYWDKDHQRHKSFGKDYGIIPWKRIRNEAWGEHFLIVELIKE